jgi:two-component system NtrC family sensor kinase
MEVIINISVLMMVAILLIGFTIAKTNEDAIIQERVRSSEDMVKDFQAILDFMAKGDREFSLANPAVRKEIQAFVDIYVKGKGFYDVMVFDQAMKPVGGKRTESPDRPYDRDRVKKAMESGLLSTDIDKTGSFLSPEYRKLKLYAPLWSQGKVAGAVRMEVPLGDVMIHLLRSQRIILLSIVVDAAILIVFGSFLLSRVLVKPLKGLVKLTQKISEGDFNEKIEAPSANEIGQLISSFNRMIERLRENQEELDEHVKSLEETNKQLKQAHEELIRTEKLATVGRFAAGVAHEVGNPLGAILGYVSMLEREGTDAEDSKDYLKRIEKEIERINHIVRELLDFSRPSKGEIRDVEVNRVLESTLSLLSYQKNFKNIDTRLELDHSFHRCF